MIRIEFDNVFFESIAGTIILSKKFVNTTVNNSKFINNNGAVIKAVCEDNNLSIIRVKNSIFQR